MIKWLSDCKVELLSNVIDIDGFRTTLMISKKQMKMNQ